MGAAARHLLANLEQHVQRRPRHEAIVEMHHGFHDDAVAGLDGEHRLLRIVVPAQLRGLHGCRKQMDFPGAPVATATVCAVAASCKTASNVPAKMTSASLDCLFI
jgi:hypothetical protein